jgi:hypothetical protein
MTATLWPPADTTSTYVRRLRSGGWLVYHRSDCRHVRGRTDVVTVDVEEVRRAIEIAPAFVSFAGRKVYLYPCRMCLHRGTLRRWP